MMKLGGILFICIILVGTGLSHVLEMKNLAAAQPGLEETGRDLAPPGAPPLDLNQCIQQALERNPNLKTAKQEQAVQVLEKPLAVSAFLPTLDAEGSYTRYGEKQRVISAHSNIDPGTFDQDLLDVGLVLRLPIFQGGKRVAALCIAELAHRLASEQLVTTEQDLVLNVASLFFKTLQVDQVILAGLASREALQSQTATTNLRVEVGRSAPLDSMKIDVRLASIEQELSRLRADQQVLRVQLGRLLGMNLSTDRPPRITGHLQTSPAPLPDIEQGRALASEQRSELKAAKVQLEKARKGLNVERAEYWPRVDGVVKYGTRSGLPYDQESATGALDHETTWSAGVSVVIPLFKGGASHTKVAQAKIKIDQAREALREAELRIHEDLERAYTNLSDSAHRILVTGKNRDVSVETLRIEQATYQEGRSTINDVLDAQSAMLRAEVEYSQAMVDHLLAQLGWQRAVGNDMVGFIAQWHAARQ